MINKSQAEHNHKENTDLNLKGLLSAVVCALKYLCMCNAIVHVKFNLFFFFFKQRIISFSGFSGFYYLIINDINPFNYSAYNKDDRERGLDIIR